MVQTALLLESELQPRFLSYIKRTEALGKCTVCIFHSLRRSMAF